MATWPIHQKVIFFSFLFMMRFGIEGEGGGTQLTRKAEDETAHQLALAQGLYRWRSQHEKCVVCAS